jgi:hypothetical protein
MKDQNIPDDECCGKLMDTYHNSIWSKEQDKIMIFISLLFAIVVLGMILGIGMVVRSWFDG